MHQHYTYVTAVIVIAAKSCGAKRFGPLEPKEFGEGIAAHSARAGGFTHACVRSC